MAQECKYSVKGRVLDFETKEPVPYAIIKVSGTEKYASSDVEGNFKIENLCSDKNTLIISCIGYSESKKDHEHDSQIHFYLTQDVTGLNEVTIQAERRKEKGTETIAQVNIGKTELASNATQSLAAAISNVQGVSFTASGANVQLPIIHGLSGNRILVLNNGLRHGFQNWGDEHAPEIDVTSAHNVNIVKGASGVRYGPEALGGVIIIDPNPLLLNKPFYANIGTGYQTNGHGYNGNIEIGKGSDKWSYFVNGNYTKLGDRNSAAYNLTNTGKEEKAFSMGVLHHYENFDFKVHYSFIDQTLGLLRAGFVQSPQAFTRAINAIQPDPIDPFSYEINDPNQQVQHHLAKAEVNWRYSDHGKLTFITGVQINKRDEFDVRRDANLPIIDLDLITYDYQLEWKHPEWHGLDGLIGLQYFSQNNDNNPGTQTTPFIPNYNSKRYSAFVIESLKFGKNTLETGVRIDLETNDVRGRETNQDIFRDNYNFNSLTASIGYLRQLSEGATFRTNIGTAWRTPNVAELFSFGQNSYAITYGLLRLTETDGVLSTSEVVLLDDSAVKAETGYKFINELQIHNDNSIHNLTGYANYIENFVFSRPLGVLGTIRGVTPGYFFDQTDALFLGLDYTWKNEWSSKISGIFGFSYLWSKNITDNESLIHQPPISTSFKLEWDQGKLWQFDSSKVILKSSYTFEQFQAPRTISPESLTDGSVPLTINSEIFDFKDAPEGYFLLDLAWNLEWKKIGVGVSVQNLLNTSYRSYLDESRYFADALGRNVLFKLNYSFKK